MPRLFIRTLNGEVSSFGRSEYYSDYSVHELVFGEHASHFMDLSCIRKWIWQSYIYLQKILLVFISFQRGFSSTRGDKQ